MAGSDGKDEAITPFKDATHYNNFYEFGTDKGDPRQMPGRSRPSHGVS